MSGTAASSSTTTTTKPTVRRRGGHANPAKFIYWVLGIVVFFLIVGLIGSQRNKNSNETHGGEFYFTDAQTGARISKMMSLDSLDRLNKHYLFNYEDKTRSLTFFSKGPVDIYLPSCNGYEWVHIHYCGEGVVNWADLNYCTGTIKVIKSDDDDCD